MTELIKRLNEIEDVYDDFILGVMNYAKRDPQHVESLHDFLDENPNVTTSEVVEFIIQQPDFHSYSATLQCKQTATEEYTIDELTNRLNLIEDAYFDFISAMLHYAQKKPSRLESMLQFLRNNPQAKSSDVVEFVSEQPDFFEDAAYA